MKTFCRGTLGEYHYFVDSRVPTREELTLHREDLSPSPARIFAVCRVCAQIIPSWSGWRTKPCIPVPPEEWEQRVIEDQRKHGFSTHELGVGPRAHAVPTMPADWLEEYKDHCRRYAPWNALPNGNFLACDIFGNGEYVEMAGQQIMEQHAKYVRTQATLGFYFPEYAHLGADGKLHPPVGEFMQEVVRLS